MSTEGKRERKATSFFKAPEVISVKKPVEIPSGSGVSLGENEYFCHELEKLKSDSDEVRALHSICYGVFGRKLEAKKNLRKFSGFPVGTSKEEKIAEIMKKSQWTSNLLGNILAALGMHRSGVRTDLVDRLVTFLMEPTSTKPVSSSVGKKRKATSAAGKKTTKRSTKKEKVSRPPSAYALFVKEHRAVVKEANPEAAFGELSKLVGQAWSALSDGEKEVGLCMQSFHWCV